MINLSKAAKGLSPIKTTFMVLIYSLFCFGLIQLLILITQNLLSIVNLAILVSASVPFAIFKLLGTKRLLCIGCIILLFCHIIFSLQLKRFILNHREIALLIFAASNIYFLYCLLQYCFVLSTQSLLLYFGIISSVMIGITIATYFVDNFISKSFSCVSNIWQQLCLLVIGGFFLQQKVFPLLGLALKTFCQIVMIIGGLLVIMENVSRAIFIQELAKIGQALVEMDLTLEQGSVEKVNLTITADSGKIIQLLWGILMSVAQIPDPTIQTMFPFVKKALPTLLEQMMDCWKVVTDPKKHCPVIFSLNRLNRINCFEGISLYLRSNGPWQSNEWMVWGLKERVQGEYVKLVNDLGQPKEWMTWRIFGQWQRAETTRQYPPFWVKDENIKCVIVFPDIFCGVYGRPRRPYFGIDFVMAFTPPRRSDETWSAQTFVRFYNPFRQDWVFMPLLYLLGHWPENLSINDAEEARAIVETIHSSLSSQGAYLFNTTHDNMRGIVSALHALRDSGKFRENHQE